MQRILATFLAAGLLATGGAALAAPQDPPPSDHHDSHRDWHGPRSGERLTKEHWGERVPDYRHHGLRRPPKGHEWRRVGDDYVLVAVATGVIASVIAASH
ncbi:MAG: RcnB family protein [Pseudoxanthomonas sp.]